LLKLVGLFSLASGALLSVVIGNKHTSELGLFRRIWDQLKKGDIFPGRPGLFFAISSPLPGFGFAESIASCASTKSVPAHFRKGKRLGKYDRLVTWQKPDRKRKTATLKFETPSRRDHSALDPLPGVLCGLPPP